MILCTSKREVIGILSGEWRSDDDVGAEVVGPPLCLLMSLFVHKEKLCLPTETIQLLNQYVVFEVQSTKE
jgi:hypothetical protein